MRKIWRKELGFVMALLTFVLVYVSSTPFIAFADEAVSNNQTEATQPNGTENEPNVQPEKTEPVVKPVITKPSQPVLESINLDKKGIVISWKSANNASQYSVYRKSNLEKKWKKVASGPKLSWRDKKVETGVTYTYTVLAENSIGKSSYDKKGLSVTYVAQPTMKSVTNETSGITITWKKSKNASGYYVYRKTTGGWKRIKKIKSGTTLSYTDTTAEAGTLYSYNVRAYYKKALSSYEKDGMSIYRLKPLKNVSAARKSKISIAVQWKRDKKASGYQIKYVNGSESNTVNIAGNKTISYVLTGLKKKTSYDIYVRSYWKSSSNQTYYSAWSVQNMVSTSNAKRKTLVIGDSRTYAMSLYGGSNAGQFYWLGEGGVSTAFINPVTQGGHTNFYVNLGRVMPNAVTNTMGCGYSFELASQIRAHGITTIVYALGTNNLGSNSGLNTAIAQAVNTMKLLKQETGCEVIFASTLPCNDGLGFSYGYTVTDARVRLYNASVKAQAEPYGISYLDTYSAVSASDTMDGLHYSVSGCTAVVNYIYSHLYK